MEVDLEKWKSGLAREDQHRFVELKRERYARFSQLAAEHWRSIEAHEAAVDSHERDDSSTIIPIGELDAVAAEIELLAPPIGEAALAWQKILREADRRYEEGAIRRLGIDQSGSKSRHEWARKQFVTAASRDLRGEDVGAIVQPD